MRSLAAVLLLCLLAACGEQPLPPPQALGRLVVATRESPLAYQLDATGQPSGLEYDLVTLFARELGLEVRFVSARDHAGLAALLGQGRAHLAAAALVASEAPALRFGPPIHEIRQIVVQHEEAAPVDTVADLENQTIEALADSPQFAALTRIAPWPAGLRLVTRHDSSELELLARVAERQAPLAVVDSAHFAVGANFYPAVQEAFDLPGSEAVAWAFPRNGDEDLFRAAAAFVERIRADGTLARVADRYFGHVHRIDQQHAEEFLYRMRTVLPRYRDLFIAAQEIHGIDWRLLAALAYQESHWDPLATSYTNVRGMMMLTEDTADRLRVGNRLDARQSILAGARYLADLRDQLPREVREPDRTWLALAAYNLGMGHLNGGRAIAQMVRRDPNAWYEMKQVLPLLSRPEYAARLKSGPARGGEAVIMVENIRTYYDILARHAADQPLAMRSMPPR